MNFKKKVFSVFAALLNVGFVMTSDISAKVGDYVIYFIGKNEKFLDKKCCMCEKLLDKQCDKFAEEFGEVGNDIACAVEDKVQNIRGVMKRMLFLFGPPMLPGEYEKMKWEERKEVLLKGVNTLKQSIENFGRFCFFDSDSVILNGSNTMYDLYDDTFKWASEHNQLLCGHCIEDYLKKRYSFKGFSWDYDAHSAHSNKTLELREMHETRIMREELQKIPDWSKRVINLGINIYDLKSLESFLKSVKINKNFGLPPETKNTPLKPLIIRIV